MAEPFLYGVIASLRSKLETSYDVEVIPSDMRAELKEKLTRLHFDSYLFDRNLIHKNALYKADDILDDADNDPNFRRRGREVFSTLNSILGSILSGKEIKKGILSLLSTELSEFLPEKLESADVGLVSCFAYCALYPKGHRIIREILVNQWMAEGFLSPTAGEELEDVGNRYFNELFRKGTFQDPVYAFGLSLDHAQVAIYSCVMHPSAHDDACRIAAQEVQVIDSIMSYFSNSSSPAGVRYLSVCHDGMKLSPKSNLSPQTYGEARTFLFFGSYIDDDDYISMVFLRSFLRCKCLRVLDVSEVQSANLSTQGPHIGAHLRYLSLSRNHYIKKFDFHYGSKYLQTLALDGCTRLEDLVLESQFTRLRHLYLTSKQKTLNLSGLTNLRILELSGCGELRLLTDDIKDLTVLTTLRIFDCPKLLSLPNNMDCLTRIQELVFHDCPSLLLTDGRCMNTLPNLRRLELIRLPKLVELPVGLQSATALQYFMVADCQNLDRLTDVLGSLISLEGFYIYKCPKLLALPGAISNLTSLRSLHIRGCPELVKKYNSDKDNDEIILKLEDFEDQEENVNKKPSSAAGNEAAELLGSQSNTYFPRILPYFTLKMNMLREPAYSKDYSSDSFDESDIDEDEVDIEEYDKQKLNLSEDNDAPISSSTLGSQSKTKMPRVAEYRKGLHNQDSESINMYSKVDINEERKKILIELQEELLEEPKLYCSLFGGDYEFEKDTIVQLWMAGGFLNNVQIEEGFLKRSDMDGELMKQMQMEDAGNLCFEILEKHEYLLPSRLDISSGKMMYKSNPDKTEASFVETQSHDLYSQLIKEQSSDCAPPIKSRHVSVLVDRINETTFTTLKKIDGLRTLLFLRNYGSSLKQIPSGVFLALKSLQALDLSGSEITQLPSSIQYLTLLRYLDLSYTPIERLPDSIGCLHELQTLKLKGCKHLCELPKGMGKLTNLRHLYFDVLGQLSYMPRSLGALTELRTLSAFLVDDRDGCNINELKGLNNLSGFFCLSGLENVPSDSVDDGLLRDKKGLTQLHLRWDRLRDKNYGDHTQVIQKLQPHSCLQELEMYCYPGSQLPIWMGKKYELEKLVRIVLFECENNELDISLGALPNLEYLEIVQMNNVSKIDNNVLRGDDNVAFPKLETLIIDGMSSLEGWERTKSCDFPALSTLVIKQCPKLATLPFLPYLHCLKHAEISRCEIFESVPHTTKETLIINRCSILEKSCSKGSTDWESIRKVPNIWINHEDPRTLNEDDTQNDSEGTGSNSDYSDDSDLGEDQVDRKDNGQTSDAELQRDTSVE